MYLVKQQFEHRGEIHKGYTFYTDDEYIKFMDAFSAVWNNHQAIWLYYEITDYDYVDIEFDRSTYLKSVDAVLMSDDTYKLISEYMPVHSGETFVGMLYDATQEPSCIVTPTPTDSSEESQS